MATPDRFFADDRYSSSYDLLVPPPQGGLTALWERLQQTLRRCGGLLMLIMLLTVALPQFLLGVGADLTGAGAFTMVNMMTLETREGAIAAGAVVGLLLTLVETVLFMLFASLGWTAGIWVVTETAGGRRVGIGEAFRGGAQWWLPMFGWYLLYSLMVAVGFLFCVLPGLYLIVAAGLFSFVVVYERGRNPVGRSFSLVHGAFGAVLGRFVLLVMFLLGAACVAGIVASLAIGFGMGDFAAGAARPGPAVGGSLLLDAVLRLVSVPLGAVTLVALLLTYTQARARWEPLSTEVLRHAIGTGQPPGTAFGGSSR